MRKDIQHLKLEVKSQKSVVSEKQHFTTAEGIELKPTYSKEDIADSEHLGLLAGFAPSSRFSPLPFSSFFSALISGFTFSFTFSSKLKLIPPTLFL